MPVGTWVRTIVIVAVLACAVVFGLIYAVPILHENYVFRMLDGIAKNGNFKDLTTAGTGGKIEFGNGGFLVVYIRGVYQGYPNGGMAYAVDERGGRYHAFGFSGFENISSYSTSSYRDISDFLSQHRNWRSGP